MFQRTVLSTFLAMLLSMVLASTAGAQATDPNLVGYWTLEDEGTGMAVDHSGNGRDGTLINQALFVPDGLEGGAMYFDGTNDRVEITGWTGILGGRARTISAWVKTTNTKTDMTIVGWGPNSGVGGRMDFRLYQGRLRWEHRSGNIQADTNVVDGDWHHVAVVIQENATCSYGDVLLYLDGRDDTRSTSDPDAMNTLAGPSVTIGIRPDDNSRDWEGWIDEVRIYDRALSEAEIQELAKWPKSHKPEPANDSVHQEESALLNWVPGAYAAEYDVYLSHDRDEVALGAPAAYQGRQGNAFLYLMSLDLGDYYYWRVDDVESDGVTLHKGDVWNFLVPAKIAYWPDPIDGRDLIDPCDLTLSWNAGMSAILHELYLGESFDDVNDGAEGTNKGVVASTSYTITEALKPETTYYWRIDETDTTGSKHKGDVWSFKTVPVFPITDPNLMCWWKLEEDSPFTVLDSSGHGNHGEILNAPEYVEGFDGMARNFRSRADRDSILRTFPATVFPQFTVSLWAKASSLGQDTWASAFTNHSPNTNGFQLDVDGTYPGNWRVNQAGATNADPIGRVTLDWVHLAVAYEGTVAYYYYNGWLAFTVTDVTDSTRTFNRFHVGTNRNGDNFFAGIIDDVRVYDKRLTQDEIKQVMRIDPKLAWDPAPTRSSVPDVREATELSWSPGDLAAQHDVYFGTDQDAVENADTSSPEYKGRRGGTTYPLAGLVEFAGGPYYWRIDEVNNDATITKGRIWNFSIGDFWLIDDIEDYNNWSPDTVWESWKDGVFFNDVANNGSNIGHIDPNLDGGETYVETGIVHGGDQSMPYYYDNDFKYSEATTTLIGEKRNWAEEGVNTLSLWYRGYPASVASFVEDPAGTYTMVSAGINIYGTEDSFTFAWKTLNGEGSITARVDSIENTNANARAGVMIRDSLDADSVNATTFVRADSTIRFNRRTDTGGTSGGDDPGAISMPRWLRIERDLSGLITAYHANDVGGTWDTWTRINSVDIQMSPPVYIGLATSANAGGTAGTAVISNVTTTGNVTEPTFTYQDIGIQSNVAEPMYVSIKDAGGQSGSYAHPDPNAVLTETWTEWNIPLTEFGAVNFGDVDTISIGFGTPGNNQPGGTGLVYFDDIRLYGSRCFPDIVKPRADFSNNCVVDMADLEIMTNDWLIEGYDVTVETISDANLEASYAFDNNLLDGSGNGRTADPCGVVPMYAAGHAGQAIDFDGTYYVNVNGYKGVAGTASRTCAAWIKTMATGQIVSWGADVSSQKWIMRIQDDNGDEGTIRVEVNGGYSVGRTDLRDGQWHHVAGVLDSDGTPNVSDLKLYVDGVLEVETALDENTINTAVNSDVRIGRAPWGTLPFVGQIDDVRIYSRAVSQAQIANLAGIPAGTVFAQPLDALLTTPEDTDLQDDEKIDFLDYAVLVQSWLDEQLWP